MNLAWRFRLIDKNRGFLHRLLPVFWPVATTEPRELAAHLPPEHAVGSGLSPGGEAGGLATLD